MAHDPVALQIFLKGLPTRVYDDVAPPSRGEEALCVSSDLVPVALEPVLIRDQKSYTVADIAKDAIARRILKDGAYNLFKVDLSEMTDDNSNDVIDFFGTGKLCNLRTLILPNDFRLAIRFLSAVFDGSYNKQLISLERIEGTPRLRTEHADIIFNHFVYYKEFVRDMSQTSSRYDCEAVFLRYECKKASGSAAPPTDLGDYLRGRRDDGSHEIYYRSGDATARGAPFIMTMT
jgi:hypothetical protein